LASWTGDLLVGSESKTLLLLGHHPTEASVLPLGDIFAADVLVWTGTCTLPRVLGAPEPERVRAVDRALRAYYEDDLPREEASAALPEAEAVALGRGIDRARALWRRTPLIPKLEAMTLGVELDL